MGPLDEDNPDWPVGAVYYTEPLVMHQHDESSCGPLVVKFAEVYFNRMTPLSVQMDTIYYNEVARREGAMELQNDGILERAEVLDESKLDEVNKIRLKYFIELESYKGKKNSSKYESYCNY